MIINPSASQSGLFNPRVLLAFALCSVSVLLAIVSFAATPTNGNAKTSAANTPLAPGAAATSEWSIVSSPNTSATQTNILSGVTCVSVSDCWAVGYYVNPDTDFYQTLIEHWDGTQWSIVSSPNGIALGNNSLASVTCSSASECWAVGYYDNGPFTATQTLILRWDGTSWSLVISPNTSATQGNVLSGVTCASASNCWAVGYYYTGSATQNGVNQTLIQRWDGASWAIVTSPNTSATQLNSLKGVTCASASDPEAGSICWAVGNYHNGSAYQTLIARWNGTSWAIVTSPNTSATRSHFLNGVTCASAAADCFAVGQYYSGLYYRTLIERWDGASWAIVTSPNTSATQFNFLNGVTCASASDCWAVGYDDAPGVDKTLIEHWDGTSWAIVTSPNTSPNQFNLLNGVTCASASDCWAIGQYSVDNIQGSVRQTLILRSTAGTPPIPPSISRPGTTERVSVASDGAEASCNSSAPPSNYPAISADGRYVAFTSWACNLVPGDNNTASDVFVHDRVTGAVERVSVASDGTEGNEGSGYPAISADGRYVAFQSAASNLVPGDTQETGNVFVHDRVTGTTERVSVASDGTPANASSSSFAAPAISADGRYVAFWSNASNLVSGDQNDGTDTFVHDRVTGVTERVSVASDGTEGNDLPHSFFYSPAVSADGRYVAFVSNASNLVPGDTNNYCALTRDQNCFDIFVHDRVTRVTERVSIASDGSEGNSYSLNPAISADGRYVTFMSRATNLVPGDITDDADVFVHDRATGATEQVSVASDGVEANDSSAIFNNNGPAISADGRFVAFWSYASNLVPNDNNARGDGDMFVHDRATRATERVSVASDGTEANGYSPLPAISGDGRYVAFNSTASNLVPGDTNGTWDVFVRDRGTVLGVGALAATCTEGTANISGWATFSGAAIASADDPPDDGAPAGELTQTSLIYRPELKDLLVRLRVASLPEEGPGALPCVLDRRLLYGMRFEVGDTLYEVRARAGCKFQTPAGGDYTETDPPRFALYRCDPDCTEQAPLSGGIGETGHEILVSAPLAALGASEGVALTQVRAFVYREETALEPQQTIDEADLPDATIPARQVSLGIAPAGTPESQVAFDTPATLAAGNFSGTLNVSALSPGNYDVWARACLGATCGPALSSPLTACWSAPTPTSAVSRKTHGTAGDFDIDLPLAGNPGIECRSGGTNNDYQMLVTFANAVTFNSAAVTSGTGTISSTTGSGTTALTVNLTGVTHAQTITLTLLGVNDGTNTGDVSVSMGVLLGDTNSNRAVNASDISQTKSQSGQTATATNFRTDVNLNGVINASDISTVKSRSGTALP